MSSDEELFNERSKGDLLKLAGVISAGAFVILLLLGATHRVVIFYDITDLTTTVLAVFAFPVLAALGLMFDTIPFKYGFAIAGIATSLALAGRSMWQSIRYNGIVVGIIVGVFKLVASLVGILVMLGAWNSAFKEKTGLRGFILSMMLLGGLGWLAARLVNGPSVLARRGGRSKGRVDAHAEVRDGDEQLTSDQVAIFDAARAANASEADARVAAAVFAMYRRAGCSRDVALKAAKAYVIAKRQGRDGSEALRAAELACGVPLNG